MRHGAAVGRNSGAQLGSGRGFCREARKKFGLLEKHKDYVVRAKAFHRKEEIIGVLLLFHACIWRLESRDFARYIRLRYF